MKKIIAGLVFIAFLIGGIIHAGSASAAEKNYPTGPCEYQDTVTAFLYGSDSTLQAYDFDEDYSYKNYFCDFDGIRTLKSKADTPVEYRSLKNFIKGYADKEFPGLWCKTGRNSGYFVHLLYLYEEVKRNAREIMDYRSFVKQYDRRPGCIAYGL